MMASAARTRKERKRKERIPEDVRIARVLLPACQAQAGNFEAVDISNHSDWDQRAMVRSGERRTIRRKPKLDTAPMRKLLNGRQLAACQWYAEAHAARYDTLGITARWGGAGGCGLTNFDHLPKTREQEDALANFDFAREGISPTLRPLFERVVIHGRPLGRLRLTFRLAAQQLVERIEGRVELAA